MAEILRGSDFESVLVNQEDIFYQFISDYTVDGDNVQINLGKYSYQSHKISKIASYFSFDVGNASSWEYLILILNLVSYSLKNLERCKSALKEFKEYNKDLLERPSEERPILKREDFDATKFRKINDNFEELHPGRLLKAS